MGLELRIGGQGMAAGRVLIVANPKAGAGGREEAVRQLASAVEARGLAPQIVTDLATLAALVARYHGAGELRAVVAAGGDGTAAEIVNRTEPGVPMTVYPLGTANLLAGYFRLPRDPRAMAQTLAEGVTARVDAGRANGRIFLLMAGCGFDADVVHRMHGRRAGGMSQWSYAGPILEAIRSYEYPLLNVRFEAAGQQRGEMQTISARWAFVVNLPYYAGGLRIAPTARGDDGLLNVSTFGGGSLWHGLRYVGYVLLGRHHWLGDYRHALVERVWIESSAQVPYQLDGDPGGFLPLEIEVLKQRLTVLAPAARLAELGLTTTGGAADVERQRA